MDTVLRFKILVLQARYDLSNDQAEFVINARLSFMRFFDLGLGADAKTIWLCREQLSQAGAVKNLLARFDTHHAKAGYLAMGGQIVAAAIVAAPKQRHSDGENAALTAGKIPEEWQDTPATLRQKDREPAGRSNSPRPNRPRTARPRNTTLRFRPSVTRTMSLSTGAMASSAG